LNLTALDQLWRSPTFPMWLTLAAAAFFGVVLLVTLLRAEKSVANGALTVITLLAIGVAVAATIRGFGPGGRPSSVSLGSPATTASLPALSCIDDLAGDTALAACEKILFGSPDSVAAAVTYASDRISRLTAFGDVAAANSGMTPELQALRRSVERDRYGLMAYVLSVRDRCQPADCAAYTSLTDHNQIAANIDERVYESAIIRYAPSWGAPAATAAAPAVATLAPSAPTGKPTNADFPSATSIPAVNIMTPEPGASPPRTPTAAVTVQSTPPRPVSGPASPPGQGSAKRQSAAKRATTASAPVQLAPTLAPVPATANE
jgi:hypothetical protein